MVYGIGDVFYMQILCDIDLASHLPSFPPSIAALEPSMLGLLALSCDSALHSILSVLGMHMHVLYGKQFAS